MQIKGITDGELEFYENKISSFYLSENYLNMSNGSRYFSGNHDILNKNRRIIGENGELFTVSNLPNNRITDNQYRKVTEQKLNYLLGKPFTIHGRNHQLSLKITDILGENFPALLRNIGLDALNCGIGWLYIYYNPEGKLCFKKFSPLEIIPVWQDTEHETLNSFIRIFPHMQDNKTITLAEIYRKDGIYTYIWEKNSLTPLCENYHRAYFYNKEKAFTWNTLPLIPFKYNCDEAPLLNQVKSLQDGINEIESDFLDVMQEDCRNSIMVLVNYDGEDLGEFRRNLAAYGAVKVQSGEGGGDVRTLNVNVNADNYLSILNVFKKALMENAKAFDIRNEKMGLNSNQLTVKSLYSDIDLDANGMETEFNRSMKTVISFIKYHLFNTCNIPCLEENFNVIFNRDMLMNESEIISNLVKSEGILSRESIIAQHPWVNNIFEELERLDKESKGDE